MNITIEAAAERLRLSAWPDIGIATVRAVTANSAELVPAPSLPKIARHGPEARKSTIDSFA